jgi:outer membrane protein
MRALVLAVAALSAPALAREPLPKLSLPEAVELALRKHPSTRVAAHLTDANRERVEQQNAAYLPRLFFGAQGIGGSLNGQQAAFIGMPDMVRIPGSGPHQRASERGRGINDLTPWFSYTVAFTTGIPIWDFGRTRGRVREAEGSLRESEAFERTQRDRVVLGVRRAYYGALVANALVRVARESVARLEVYAAQANEMVQRGVRPPIEVPRTQAELARARARLILARNDAVVARQVLDNAIGVRTTGRYELVDDRQETRVVATLEELLPIAMDARPEIAEHRGRVLANEGQLETATSQYYPILSGTAGINVRGVGGFGSPMNYDAGMLATWPLFDGYLAKRQADEARARRRGLDWSLEELRQRIELEVRSAYAVLQTAGESIAAARLAAYHSEENLKLAVARFRQGLSQIIELADAEALFISAQADVVRAIYDYKIADANLERAVGRRLPRRAP